MYYSRFNNIYNFFFLEKDLSVILDGVDPLISYYSRLKNFVYQIASVCNLVQYIFVKHQHQKLQMTTPITSAQQRTLLKTDCKHKKSFRHKSKKKQKRTA